jgi:hypothetical protein
MPWAPTAGSPIKGCVVLPPDAEAKEHRLDITLTFLYAFRLGDLAP